MGDYEIKSIIYSLALLLILVPAYLSRRGNAKKEMKNAAIWLAVFTLLVIGALLFH